MNLDDALQTFIEESRELLEEMEEALLSLNASEGAGGDALTGSESVNAIFRAAHTIKGSAGLFGLSQVVAFTHVAESVLDKLRSGHLDISPSLVALLLACCDHMRGLTDAVAAGNVDPDPDLERQGEPLLVQLRRHLDANAAPAAVGSHAAAAPAVAVQRTVTTVWHISVRFGTSVLRNGMDPLSFVRYLGTMGTLRSIVVVSDALPDSASMDPECCYLGLDMDFETMADKAQIEGVFEFVVDDCTLRVVPSASDVAAQVALIRALPDSPNRLGDILTQSGSVTEPEIQRALAAQGAAAGGQLLGQILIAQQATQPAIVDAALERQQKGREAKARESQSVRVDSDKLDQLINLVGELIIAQAGATVAARRTADADLHEAHSLLGALVQEVRDSALQLRMVKIGATLNRFQRVVHDTSRDLGKDIALVVKGEDTELDKTVVEKIGDPLTHLVRNAIDHGIDMPDVRLARGKPARGTVTLNAYHDAGQVVIEVSDDGNGMDRARLLAKGVERGLVAPEAVLSDGEVFNLIFEPGFSTAEQVTNLSGRGVGMDVVRRNIVALRGTVNVTSRHTVGTTVVVRLPLTLAIIDGFQVGVGNSVFVVPLDMVEECVEYRDSDATADCDYIDLRGQVLPLIGLRALFEVSGEAVARQNIVVLRHDGHKVGLVVDALLGEAQTVIKPLSKMFAHVKGISGSSIRGSGDVALILDVPALIKRAARPAALHASLHAHH